MDTQRSAPLPQDAHTTSCRRRRRRVRNVAVVAGTSGVLVAALGVPSALALPPGPPPLGGGDGGSPLVSLTAVEDGRSLTITDQGSPVYPPSLWVQDANPTVTLTATGYLAGATTSLFRNPGSLECSSGDPNATYVTVTIPGQSTSVTSGTATQTVHPGSYCPPDHPYPLGGNFQVWARVLKLFPSTVRSTDTMTVSFSILS